MDAYWKTPPQLQAQHASSIMPPSLIDSDSYQDSFVSEFDRHWRSLLAQGVNEEWQLELWRYLQDMPADVSRDMDIVAWWSVRTLKSLYFIIVMIL
jgi:hypothetical protein